MSQRFITLLFALALPFMLMGQTRGVCGFTSDKAFQNNIQYLKKQVAKGVYATRGNTVTYVPTKWHIISKNDGTKGISEQAVLDALCELNQEYADQNIQFYIYGGFNYINNTTAYNDPSQAQLTMQGSKDGKAMNIFMGLNPTSASGPPGGTTLGYFSGLPTTDWLVIRNSEVNGSSGTIPHEVGHYFNLDHPHNGWDCTAWDPAEHGNPVNITTAPCERPEGFVPVELADGSNCDIAGDYLCDTPPDYNFGYTDNDDCIYNYDCMDPNGDLVDPMEDNFMGYFIGCADYEFTPQQKDIMAARLAERTNLATIEGAQPTVEGTTNLIQPADGSTTTAYNNVAFEWEAVPGANQYLLEIDLSTSFNIAPIRLIVWGNYKVISDMLISDKNYYWRVRPFNQFDVCAPISERWSFTTGTATSTLEPAYVTNWMVRPNPATAGQSLQLEMHTQEAFEATISLRTLSGQSVYTAETSFSTGNSTIEIPTFDLINGLYFLTVQSEGGILNERVVITR